MDETKLGSAEKCADIPGWNRNPPQKGFERGDVLGRVVCHVKLSACVLSCDSRESLSGQEMVFDVKGKNGFSSSSRLQASGCFVRPYRFIVFQTA